MCIKILKDVDTRRKAKMDFRFRAQIDSREPSGHNRAMAVEVYRRDAANKTVILVTAPKVEAGRGYLESDRNLFFYDLQVGRWNRQTKRDTFEESSFRISDFSAAAFIRDYTAEFVGEEKLGELECLGLKLTSKPGADVEAPIMDLWVDKEGSTVLKRQEFGTAGKVMRTAYYPHYACFKSKADDGGPLCVPDIMHTFDGLVKGKTTKLEFADFQIGNLEDNIFTKAWLEARSR